MIPTHLQHGRCAGGGAARGFGVALAFLHLCKSRMNSTPTMDWRSHLPAFTTMTVEQLTGLLGKGRHVHLLQDLQSATLFGDYR